MAALGVTTAAPAPVAPAAVVAVAAEVLLKEAWLLLWCIVGIIEGLPSDEEEALVGALAYAMEASRMLCHLPRSSMEDSTTGLRGPPFGEEEDGDDEAAAWRNPSLSRVRTTELFDAPSCCCRSS